MVRRKPAPDADTDVIVKGFRVAGDQPITVRLINPIPKRARVRVLPEMAALGDIITLDPPRAGGDPVTFDFEVQLHGARESLLRSPVEPTVVEIGSGAKRYRESVVPSARALRLRYHLYLTEPSTGQILCERHGVVTADANGQCPYAAPHTAPRLP